MKNPYQFTQSDLRTLAKKWGWFLSLGILLIILGIIAIGAAGFTTLISVIFLGVVVLTGGVVITIDSFNSWWGKWKGFALHLIIGLLYLIVGALLIKHPVSASISLTLLLGIFYLMVGAFRLIYPAVVKGAPNWGWGFFSGIVSLLLGALILASWPMSSLYIIGLFVGIDLLFSGWSYVMVGLSAKALAKHRKNEELQL